MAPPFSKSVIASESEAISIQVRTAGRDCFVASLFAITGNKDANCRLGTLGDAPPLVDELAWRHLLERDLDGGAHWRLVGRGAREIGVEIDPRGRVQRHHCQV